MSAMPQATNGASEEAGKRTQIPSLRAHTEFATVDNFQNCVLHWRHVIAPEQVRSVFHMSFPGQLYTPSRSTQPAARQTPRRSQQAASLLAKTHATHLGFPSSRKLAAISARHPLTPF